MRRAAIVLVVLAGGAGCELVGGPPSPTLVPELGMILVMKYDGKTLNDFDGVSRGMIHDHDHGEHDRRGDERPAPDPLEVLAPGDEPGIREQATEGRSHGAVRRP